VIRIIDLIDEAYRLVLDFFDGDRAKTDLWFQTKNPLLGNIRPAEMAIWQTGKLLKFIKECLGKNETP